MWFCYYKWCASHPEINIQVSESTAGNNLKIEAPQIIYTTRHGIEIAPEIELQIVEIQFQHEGICSLLKEAYQSSDIQLDLSVKNGKTIMEKPRHLQAKKKIMILKQNLILR